MTNVAVRDSQNGVAPKPPMGYRGAPRRRLAVPMSVTVLRCGVPDAVPGRSVDVGGGGVGVVLAAELQRGELVGVEFRLPESASVLAKARVCYQERLRCGLQFLAIPAEQKEAIEAWISGRPAPVAIAPTLERANSQRVQPPLPKFLTDPKSQPVHKNPKDSKNVWFMRRKIMTVLAASVIAAAAVGWWQWEQAWQQLESRLPGQKVEAVHSPRQVDWEVMQRLLVHDVPIPTLPGARRKGVAVLSAVIGRDGSVSSLRPISGPDSLMRAAMDSVQWWKFEPYRVNGAPVEVETTLAVEFR
jgi:hypothetical protein